MEFERYWIFAACCAIVVGFLVRLLLRERVSLQHSLAFLLFMLGVVTTAVFPSLTYRLGHLMGFALPSNFFFAILIGVLVLLHLGTVIALSRLEARTIALIQDLGLVQEQMNRMSGGVGPRTLASDTVAVAPTTAGTAEARPPAGPSQPAPRQHPTPPSSDARVK
jgi:hypothetical protein